MEFKEDKGVGYMYCYAPNHYCANKAGKVYEHVYVMCESIGRALKSNECVHHIDRDRTNNDISNLKLMTVAEHVKLHAMEDRGTKYVSNTCKVCNVIYETSEKTRRTYCSHKCAKKYSRKFEVSPEELELLVWSKPTVEVAKILGVSDVAIAKRCKKLGIDKPPRGYWAKVKAENH